MTDSAGRPATAGAPAPIRLAVGIPQTWTAGRLDLARVRRLLERAEELGFESAWVVEQVLGAIPCLGAVELLAWAAAVTRRLRLGTAVLLTPLRTPVHLAKSLATLDQLSGGRLEVGVGLGANTTVYPAYGLTPARRVARFTEGLRLLRALWTEPRVTFAGEFWRLEGVALEPKPVQRPHPPLWLGAHHPKALRRVVAEGAHFMGAGSASTATFARELGQLRAFLAEAGRDPAAIDVGKRVYVAVDEDRERAGRRLAHWFGAFYGRPELAPEVSVYGPPDACAAGLREVVAAGARLLLLNPVFDEVEQLECLAAEVIPRL
jgi:probable F420-dependent oxidoreductase